MTTSDNMLPTEQDDLKRDYEEYADALKREFPHAQPLPFREWLTLHATLAAATNQ
jgi:hypothetical protein